MVSVELVPHGSITWQVSKHVASFPQKWGGLLGMGKWGEGEKSEWLIHVLQPSKDQRGCKIYSIIYTLPTPSLSAIPFNPAPHPVLC